jgi:hypothetical protein
MEKNPEPRFGIRDEHLGFSLVLVFFLPRDPDPGCLAGNRDGKKSRAKIWDPG